MKSLNTSASVREVNNIIYQFKRWYNSVNKDKMYLYNSDLNGKSYQFRLWLIKYKNIDNFEKHLQKTEQEFNDIKFYFSRSKGRYKILNR
jgi:hypothetical protein